jgi:hypothetical protein
MYRLTERLYDDECTRFRRKAFFALMKEHRSVEAGVISM